jgi:integral membrane protein (TIGR01906 family)
MKVDKNKVLLVIFCISIITLLLLLSYKIALGTTELTENQDITIKFLVDNHNLELNYTSSEKSHLEDVKGVMQGLDYLFYLSLLVVTLIITIHKKKKEIIKKLFYYSGISSLVFFGIIMLFSLISFNSMFTYFHKIFFPQGNWLFPIDSLLIQTFPIQFFITISLKVMVISIIVAAGMIFISRRIKNDI